MGKNVTGDSGALRVVGEKKRTEERDERGMISYVGGTPHGRRKEDGVVPERTCHSATEQRDMDETGAEEHDVTRKEDDLTNEGNERNRGLLTDEDCDPKVLLPSSSSTTTVSPQKEKRRDDDAHAHPRVAPSTAERREDDQGDRAVSTTGDGSE